MARALDEYIIEGIKTTIPFHKRVMSSKDFIEGNIDTGFIDRFVLE
jgi:acetyl-CoA carboxylase biotin carboxylase subunit